MNSLQSSFPLTPEDIQFYQDNGFIQLKHVFDAELLLHFRKIIEQPVLESAAQKDDLAERDTYHRAFVQVTNLWEQNPAVREFVFGKRLARIATELMRVGGVRLYHDQALFKEPGGGFTPWHADQQYWPLASDTCVTAWIPLQDTPVEMGPIAFACGSHKLNIGRDLAISDQSEQIIAARLSQLNISVLERPFELGDVSFHAGWTLHRAAGNKTDHTRGAMTIIYMDENMRLAAELSETQQIDREAFCPEVLPGTIINSAKNPVLFSGDVT